jgi:hypothetical protein
VLFPLLHPRRLLPSFPRSFPPPPRSPVGFPEDHDLLSLVLDGCLPQPVLFDGPLELLLMGLELFLQGRQLPLEGRTNALQFLLLARPGGSGNKDGGAFGIPLLPQHGVQPSYAGGDPLTGYFAGETGGGDGHDAEPVLVDEEGELVGAMA